MKLFPIQSFNTPQDIIQVATPEVIAMDMVMYPRDSAGFDNIFNVLAELVEAMDKQRLYSLAKSAIEFTWMQRLGYLFDQSEQTELSKILLQQLTKRCTQPRILLSGEPKLNAVYEKNGNCL